jgi:hypothetical protein
VDYRIVMPYHQETSRYDQPSLSIDDVRRLPIELAQGNLPTTRIFRSALFNSLFGTP